MSDSSKALLQIKGVGEKRAELFKKLGVVDPDTLFSFYPRTYEDWSNQVTVAKAPVNEVCCIRARVITPVKEHYIRSNMILYKFIAEDEDGGQLYVTVFNNRFIKQTVKTDCEYLFMGKTEGGIFEKSMSSPQISRVGNGRIRPIYRSVSGLPSSTIEKTVETALRGAEFPDYLPEGIKSKYSLCELGRAINTIHFPKKMSDCRMARRRLAFDELFVFEAAMLYKKSRFKATAGAVIENDRTGEFISSLPYSLTGAQGRVVKKCIEDMASGKAMSRLVQGDVGCGKTAVAAALMYNIAVNRGQAVLLAPTELLAEQHYKGLSGLFSSFGITTALITGSVPKRQKEKLKSAVASGEISVIIGTHALLEENVEFKELELIITDEQHRFGVGQRSMLMKKGCNVHTLYMSATPIPRTMAQAIYGDLDISIIDELPAGRKPVKTVCIASRQRARALKFINSELKKGHQAYIVCPAVEENEQDMLPVTEYYKAAKEYFPDFSVGMLHGRMKPSEKESVMSRFSSGELRVLTATTVIEVGIDVPNATVMMIENAERFGLSQLHQLRGRIGRGGLEGMCILVAASDGAVPERLKVLCETSDGMKIAEEDLRLRGPGDFFGSRQHGLPEMKIADIAADSELLRAAIDAAEQLLKSDPTISLPENKGIRRRVAALLRQATDIGND